MPTPLDNPGDFVYDRRVPEPSAKRHETPTFLAVGMEIAAEQTRKQAVQPGGNMSGFT
jgi:hypothetical protein